MITLTVLVDSWCTDISQDWPGHMKAITTLLCNCQVVSNLAMSILYLLSHITTPGRFYDHSKPVMERLLHHALRALLRERPRGSFPARSDIHSFHQAYTLRLHTLHCDDTASFGSREPNLSSGRPAVCRQTLEKRPQLSDPGSKSMCSICHGTRSRQTRWHASPM